MWFSDGIDAHCVHVVIVACRDDIAVPQQTARSARHHLKPATDRDGPNSAGLRPTYLRFHPIAGAAL